MNEFTRRKTLKPVHHINVFDFEVIHLIHFQILTYFQVQKENV